LILRYFILFLGISLLPGLVSAETLTEKYKPVAQKLIDAALKDDDGYDKLAWLCYRIGNRLGGSPALDEAVKWSAETMRKDGLSNVTVQPAKVPKWVRGRESATLVAPMQKELHMLGLGMSIGTPPEGITAAVVAVNSFDELDKLGAEKVKGRIVLYNVPYVSYGQTVMYRSAGASRAAAHGAVAALVRSVTPLAMQQPHTGSMSYDPAQPKIPAAALSVEDTLMLARLAQSGEVRVRLKMEARQEADADSANVFGEILGSEKPEEVVVLGGHLDSWDVGQGAQDDGSGIIASLQAVALMKKLGLQPRRTVRVVFWTNEENGTRGGQAYRAALGDRLSTHVAAIEMDGGAEQPVGFGYGGGAGGGRRRGAAAAVAPTFTPAEEKSAELLKQIAALLEPVGANQILPGGGGADIGAMTRDGVPGLGLRTVGTHYFDWHHTETDTLDKVNKDDFRKNIAALAVMAYVLADMPETLAGSR
jgi:Zn-dependent M28 family amino/carboxypeptidase